ncbi:MAG: tetratricopeptide repeat protein [Desulfomonilia bacterium]|jgi:tetratricopeptide (TPR) repeat protein
MKKLWIPVIIILVLAGCATTFQEKRNLSKPMVGIAMGKIQRGDIHGALVELKRAAKENPKDPEVYYAYALAYLKSEKYDQALENVERAISLADRLSMEHPGLKSEAYNLKGTILVHTGNSKDAIKAFQNALKDELYATPEYAHYNLASVYFHDRKYEEAERWAQQALAANSHYAPAWNILGQVYLRQGRDAQAIEAFKKAILEFPGYAEAHWELAQAYFKVGNISKAAEHLREVIRLDESGLLAAAARQSLQDLGESGQ